MTTPHPIDIDWLHSAVNLICSDQYRYRYEGKTTAYLYLMLGEYECGDSNNTYLYIGQTSQHTHDTMFDFIDLLHQEHGDDACVKQSHQHVSTTHNQRFYFVSLPQLLANPAMIRSQSIDRIFFDVDDTTQHAYDDENQIQDLFNTVLPTLTYRHGDVI